MLTFGSTTADALVSATAVVSDPALPEVLRLVKRLEQIEKAKSTSSGKPSSSSPGIGLKAAIEPLKAVIYIRENTWALPVAIAGAIGIPLLFGFALGRRLR